jgi:hypothetical protein
MSSIVADASVVTSKCIRCPLLRNDSMLEHRMFYISTLPFVDS